MWLGARREFSGVAAMKKTRSLRSVARCSGVHSGARACAREAGFSSAVEMGIFVVRAFVRMRELAAVHADLAKRLAELEQKTEGLALSHDTFSRNTRAQLRQLIEAVNQLMTPPDPPKRPIGFVTPEDKGKKTSGARGKT